MGAVDVAQTQKCMNELNAGDIADRRKKKKKQKKKRRRKDGAAIAKIGEASKESGPQQVASSLDPVLNCIESYRNLKKRRRLRGLQKREPPSDEASSEKEKQSLLAWVEMCMRPHCNTNAMQELHGDIESGCFAKRIFVDRSSNGHTRSLTACVGNDSSGPLCDGDAFPAVHEVGTCDHVSNAQAFEVDHESYVCSKKSSSNGHDCHSVQSSHEGLRHGSSQERGQSFIGEISLASHTSTAAHHGSLLNAFGHAESKCSCPAITKIACQTGLSGERARSGEDNLSCRALELEISNNSSLPKGNDCVLSSNSANPHNNKRKREDDKVLQYVLKRNVVVHASPSKPLAKKARTTKTVVIAWGRNIPVTLTSESQTVQEWISSQDGNLFGLDVEWRPNRAKGEKNKVALLQLCNESECLIIQMLFLDKKPVALCKLLSDPSKSLAGVGVLADGKRLLHDYGLQCQGGIELTTLAVERLKRDELRNVGLKVLVQEVLGLKMDKPKKVTLSNWAKVTLDPAQINYACMDAWASFALSRKLLVDM